MLAAYPHRHTLRRCALLTALVAGVCLALAACAPKREDPDLEIQLPAELPAGVRFRWHHVPSADGYRLVFLRMAGAPVCTVFVAQQKSPEFLIQRDSMPSGLGHGWQLNLEIRAMRAGVPQVEYGIRPLKTP
jgi:hypothetical protein